MDRLIPFTPDVYVGMIEGYNVGLWPAQLVGLAFIWTMIVCARRRGRANAGIALTIIAGFWIWVGYGFHLERYAQLNWAAVAFGWIFIAQGLLMLLWGATSKKADVRLQADMRSVLGLLLIITSLGLHPLLTYIADWPIAAGQTAGMAPLSLVLLSFGGLAFLTRRPPLWLIAVPVLWCIWEFAWAWTLNLWPDCIAAAIAVLSGVLCALPRAEKQ